MTNIIVSNKDWHFKYVDEISARTGTGIIYLDKKEQVTFDFLNQYKPEYIFFPHWSHIISPEIYNYFKCVVFHMTDLPFGRGGSPLQNLIARKIYETKLSALACDKELDGGDIYIKKNLSLWGTAEEIYLRAAELTKEMIIEIIKEKITPIKQCGEVIPFKRRKPAESDISKLTTLEDLFDYIRMLDAKDYPRAFLDTEYFHFEFERATLKYGYVKSDVVITLKEAKS